MKIEFYTEHLFQHQKIYDRLIGDTSVKRPQQSYIFSGPSGIGKRTTAFRFARHLLCDNNSAGGCGQCLSCQYFREPWTWHPDLIYFQQVHEPLLLPRESLFLAEYEGQKTSDEFVASLSEGKWIEDYRFCTKEKIGLDGIVLNSEFIFDKSGQRLTVAKNKLDILLEKASSDSPALADIVRNIYSSLSPHIYRGSLGVGNIRQSLVNKAGEKPYMSKHKVFILDGAENMTVEAQNALLKTLEEPPPFTTIFLITRSRNTLLPTVRSRCQTIMFAPPNKKEAITLIKALINCAEAEADFRATISKNNISQAIFLDREIFSEQQKYILNMISHFKNYSYQQLAEDILFLSNALKKNNESMLELSPMIILENTILKILYQQSGNEIDTTEFGGVKDKFQELSKILTPDDLVFIAERLSDVKLRLSRNVFDQWNIEHFLNEIRLYFFRKKELIFK